MLSFLRVTLKVKTDPVKLVRVMGKPESGLCENKGTDDQCLFLRYIGSAIPLLPKSGISKASSYLPWLY